MPARKIIALKGGVSRNPSTRLAAPAYFTLNDGEHIAVVGPNGTGKSLLVDILTSKYPLREGGISYDFSPAASQIPYENIEYIAFRDSYGAADTDYYYQQRWNTQDYGDAPTVSDVLGETAEPARRDELYKLFKMESLLDKPIILLSNGELRKFQLIRMLVADPRVLIIDNPFIGLDAPSRLLLDELLCDLARKSNLQIITVVSRDADIPTFTTHVVLVKNMLVGEKTEKSEYFANHAPVSKNELPSEIREQIKDLPYKGNPVDTNRMVELNNTTIRYGDRTILKNLDWRICKGEKWALSGENGAGKSTLLSIICADNPQSYACDIALFGRKRGTGESIWNIKKRIGYVSPEMHRAYMVNIPAAEIVASGLFDTIGLYNKPNPDQIKISEFWMDVFGIGALKERPMMQLSSGEQRLVLVARAFVKDPELLILDEPLHGLDEPNRARVKEIITAFCARRDKTMIMVTHYEEELPPIITGRLFLRKNL